MANAWEQIKWIAAESLNHLEDVLVVTQLAAKDLTADFNERPNGYAIGSSVDIRTNPVYDAKEFGSAIEIQEIRASARSLTIEKHFDVSVQITAKEKRLDMDRFSEQVIMPAPYALAEKSDRYVAVKLAEAQGLYSSTDLFTSASDMALAKKAATFQQLSTMGRFCIVNDELEAALLGANYFTTYDNRGESGQRVFNDGAMGRAMGMDFYGSLSFPDISWTAGNGVGATKTAPTGDQNKVGQTSLTLQAAATGTFKNNDRIKIAGVRRPLIVKGDQATPSAIVLQHPITDLIPKTAAVTVIGSGRALDVKGAIFDAMSLVIASPVLDMPSDKPSAVLSNNGFSIRVVQGYDINKKTETISLDLLIGAKAFDPRRITLLSDT